MTPTEEPETVLSMDTVNPTKITWDEFIHAKFKPYVFGPDAKWIPGSFALVHQRPGWNTFFLVRDKYPDPKSRPLAVNGYADVTMPDGEIIFILQEAVLNSDRTVAFWNYGWDERDLVNPLAVPFGKELFFNKKKLITSGDYYFVPMGKKGDDKACIEWVSPYVCQHTIAGVAGLVESFVTTGMSDLRLSQGILEPNNDVWSNSSVGK